MLNDFFESDNPANPKAPLCKLGEDCFADVSHKKIHGEIKKLAFSVTQYMKDRISQEEQTGSSTQFFINTMKFVKIFLKIINYFRTGE